MPASTIICVDDEPQVLNAVERDLRSHYGGKYRIVKAGSGAAALDLLKRLNERGDLVALFLADQRMPGMTGTDFLAEAKEIYPTAKKVLLTAYADTEAAISCINSVGLDHYLMKPWDPPEQLLYPVLDDLLADWEATAPIEYDGIRVAGALWSALSHDVKDFLARHQLPYQWMDIERDEKALAAVEKINGEGKGHDIPIVFFPDGTHLVKPDTRQLADKVGLQTEADHPFYDLIIIGGGPAGLGAAVYGASEGLRTAMIEKAATGGQAGSSSRIENYLGFPNGLSGTDLARRASTQARRLGAEILTAADAVSVRAEDQVNIVELADGTELMCRALVLATGMTTRQLEVEGVSNLAGAGIYYGAANTEAAFYRDKPVFVIGGANSAGQGAMLFSQFASKVTMIVRSHSLEATMSQYLIDQINETPNIEVLFNSEVDKAYGDSSLEAIDLKNNKTGEIEKLDASAMFIFIGAAPHSELVSDMVATNESGFILTGVDVALAESEFPLERDPYMTETSVPGIFAAGDVQHGTVKRVATAVGQGALCVSFVHQYLSSV
ncbi:FAD-dependent oxidoreductase [Candidatus Lucifugimonas marina]|uniref:Response regulator n=1 Tax=Candidatus Lucifugimonas marina TaxID=3038979 RepID=A0AAJ5ZIJ2_9CHLR|nr:response regulator [SAR202 cluster bacterium JH702]MDG0870753.1 response regulator [SAR202 cluster bacterium JH639]WFG34838.1 response regulator [SAR202 cluster bacterium JH545]WFG38778.1 response regulator [SAR202 cluster bacterium JH1073]